MKFSPHSDIRSTLGRVEPEYVFAVLLVLGVLMPMGDQWGILAEYVLLPLFVWLISHHGVGRSRGAVLMCLPILWIAWVGASGGWGTASAFEHWDDNSLAALMTAMFFVMSVTFVRASSRRFLELSGAGLVLAASATLVAGIAMHALKGGLATTRLSGLAIFHKENHGSFAGIFVALMALHLAHASKAGSRLVMLLCPFVVFSHILLAGSRGGLLVFPLVLGSYLLFREPRSAGRILMIGGGAAVLSITAFLVLIPGAEEFLLRTLERETYRVEIWQDAWLKSRDRLVLGHGWGDDTLFSDRFSHPHNLHLSNLFYAGLPGLALGISTIVGAILLAFSIRDQDGRALALAAVVLVILSTLAHGSLPISKPNVLWYSFWAPLALLWGLVCRSEEQRC